MQKKERQDAIVEIVRLNEIASQAEIVEMLLSRGVAATQASVSRDIDELGIIKANGHYLVPQRTENAGIGPVSFRVAGDNLVVAQCTPGLASAITVAIDRAHLPEIVGTIAGDDTIFIAVENKESRDAAIGKVSAMFQ